MGNSRKNRQRKLHRRLVRAGVIVFCVSLCGFVLGIEVVKFVAGSALAAFLDVVFMELL